MTGTHHTDRLREALCRLDRYTQLFGTPTQTRDAFEVLQEYCSLALAAPHSTVLLGHNQDVTLWDVPVNLRRPPCCPHPDCTVEVRTGTPGR